MGPAMRAAALLTALALRLAAAGAAANEAAVTPVQKVIQLITDMEAKAKAEKNAEAVEFSKFSQFCKDTQANKDAAIKKKNEMIETLSADIEKLNSDIIEVGDKIDELQKLIEKSTSDLKAAEKQRAKEKAEYTEQIQDFSGSVDALERAVVVLEKQSYDRKQASEALVQLSTASGIPDAAHRTIMAFVEMNMGDDFLTRDGPEANAYEFQSGGILDLLKKLRVEFQEKKSEAEKAGMNSAHAFDMLQQDLHDTIENANTDVEDNTMVLQEKKQLLAEDKKQLGITTKDRDEDVQYLSDLKVECEEKTKSFEEKQGLRAEEIEAMAKAKEILSSPAVLGNAEEHLPAAASLVQAAAKRSLAQLRASKVEAPDSPRRALTVFLRSEGRRLKSKNLGMLAEKVSRSSADPFTKVKKMIEEMITKLLKEAGEESEHKGWCDTELGTNQKTRTKLQNSIDGLTAKIEESEATITEMTQRLATLAEEIDDLTVAMKEATDIRTKESAKNAETVEDAQAAQKAVAAAVAVLKDFYDKAATATALIQEPISYGKEDVKMGTEEWDSLANPGAAEVDRGHKAGMQTFGKTYSGQQDEAGGVLAMLEVISSDFSRLEADTSASEAEAADTHKTFMADSSKDKAVKSKETEMLTADRTTMEAELKMDKKDLGQTQDQLLAADRYYEKLKPSCVDLGMSYEQRAQARQEEIQSLQEALKILSGEDIA